jgi:hypothetical protein
LQAIPELGYWLGKSVMRIIGGKPHLSHPLWHCHPHNPYVLAGKQAQEDSFIGCIADLYMGFSILGVFYCCFSTASESCWVSVVWESGK